MDEHSAADAFVAKRATLVVERPDERNRALLKRTMKEKLFWTSRPT
jgi:hypothetical protein